MSYLYFSENADRRLFFCSETGEQGIRPEFVRKLDILRARCGFPFTITSGYRSPRHSIEAAKAKPGMHTLGIAADIAVSSGVQKYEIIRHAIEMGFKGIGVADDFIHVDDREGVGVIWSY